MPNTDPIIDLDTSFAHVQHGIAPPMHKAITIPLRLDGRDGHGVALYIAESGFKTKPLNDKELRAISDRIVAALRRGLEAEP